MEKDREHLILRYLTGTLTAEEQRAFASWMDESGENKKMVDDFRTIWETTQEKAVVTDFHTSEEWAKFESAFMTKPRKESKVRSLFTEPWLKVAASVLLVCLSSFVIYQFLIRSESVVVQTTTNSTNFLLPDGSNVWLNAESTLSYKKDFTERRNVTLQGEGFFDVKKDAEHPFTINTGDAEVKVLGTSFNVRAYDREGSTKVLVLTGRVSFETEDGPDKVVLTPGMTGILSNGNEISVDTEVDQNQLAWKNKELIFKRSPLRSVVKTLSEYFKKDIRIRNKDLEDCRFTGSFKNPSLDEVLESLTFALDLKMDNEQNLYILDGVGCKTN
jgi:ferric-dicitrate binding protein FerR (iron transport regulator)